MPLLISDALAELDNPSADQLRPQSGGPRLNPHAISKRLDRSPRGDELAQAEHLNQALRDDGYRVEVFAGFRAGASRYLVKPVDPKPINVERFQQVMDACLKKASGQSHIHSGDDR
jgi:hypothetical protein